MLKTTKQYFDNPLHVMSDSVPEKGRVKICLSKPTNLFVRMPGWAPRDSVRSEVAGRRVTSEWRGQFVFLPRDLFPLNSRRAECYRCVRNLKRLLQQSPNSSGAATQVIEVRPSDVVLPFYPNWPEGLKVHTQTACLLGAAGGDPPSEKDTELIGPFS